MRSVTTSLPKKDLLMTCCPPIWQARSRALRIGGLLLATQFLLVPTLAAAPPAAPGVGINSKFLDPDLDPQEWVDRFEVESREVFHAREAILDALRLAPGARIADVGCGTGAFLKMFSQAVGPEGRVYAVDISPRLIEFVERRIRDERLSNIAAVHSTATSTKLSVASVSTVFTCDTYHHFEQYPEMLASIRQALVPGGLFVVVDFERVEGVSREWILGHVRAGKETVRQEVEAAGFEFVDEVAVPAFKENYLLRFRRPTGSAAE
jgi:ubiquinone/menaquinone biosynthesis C-methylase UbiE